jgi:hypothetical protein
MDFCKPWRRERDTITDINRTAPSSFKIISLYGVKMAALRYGLAAKSLNLKLITR